MFRLSKDIDSAFQGVGTKGGLEVWCIHNNQLISIPKSSFGRFHSGNAYLLLSTALRKIGSPQYDIHYWLGHDATEVDSVLASDKALELDAALGCCTVQYREVQGQETEKFLSYFKPCIIPVEGKYSPQNGLAEETYPVTLLMCKGDHAVRVKEVPFLRSSLNHDDVFVLDTASKVFLFAGCNSSTQEKAKALEVVEYIKDNKHAGRCQVATIGDADAGEFWTFFGGYAPIPKCSSSTNQEQTPTTCAKLLWIDTRGNLHPTETSSLNKDMLEKDKCYMLDCDSEVFVWMGRNTSLTERKTSISSSEEFLRKEGRSTSTSLVLLTEGLENARFRSFFDEWPQTAESSLYNEGREKVAAMFKRKGYDVEEFSDEEDEPLYTNCRDAVKVWRVDGGDVSLLSIHDQAKLFSGDCYIVHMEEDRADAISNASAIVSSTKGESVMCHIHQGNEPARFYSMFQSLVVFKGGLSKRYKTTFLVENANECESKASLFRVQGTSSRSMQAIQVDLVGSLAATSLNSSYCYILKNEASVFTWIGKLTSESDHDVLDRMLYFLDPSRQPMTTREGSEPDTFWDLLGNDVLKAKEVYNFVQDDLTTEDVLLLDCQTEVYVWIGLNST
ncbi:hypothetical protein HID58_092983 [Brassica napus]|uniref:Gelsolin-like domain-containing protein n=1 Tax=Brassica napus TaxID=3708 RepID=A0ABQ7XEV9_BRANA|nr:hypothetical protein HID58_092983 [Brassica napus]